MACAVRFTAKVYTSLALTIHFTMVKYWAMNQRKGKVRILVIEDDTPVAMMIVNLLTRAKCEVVVAQTAAKGVQLAEKENFNLVTLDINLPDGNGVDLCRRLKANPRFSGIPIVFVSGPSGQDLQHGFDAGAADHIAKPFAALEFASRVLAHLHQPKKPVP
jgi:DNA-binding response OmpR family regulator